MFTCRRKYPPKVAVSTPVGSLRGMSSRLLRKHYQARMCRDHM